ESVLLHAAVNAAAATKMMRGMVDCMRASVWVDDSCIRIDLLHTEAPTDIRHRPHSSRNATVGSTRVARSAGMYVASIAVAIRTIGTIENVIRSVALTPNRRLAMTR